MPFLETQSDLEATDRAIEKGGIARAIPPFVI